MSKYKNKKDTIVFTNQDCVFYIDNAMQRLKFTKTRTMAHGIPVPDNDRLMEVKLKTQYRRTLHCVLLKPRTWSPFPSSYSCRMNLGVSNTVVFVYNNGLTVLYKGGFLKTANKPSALKISLMKWREPSKASM